MDQLIYYCGDFRIEPANRRFSHDGIEVVLEPRVLAVILQLLAKPAELVTREELLDAVWGHRFVTPSTLNRVIALARRAFTDDVEHSQFIQTVHGAGYRYVGPIDMHGGQRDQPPLVRFGPPYSAALPAPLESLIGRTAELDQMQTLLADGRALTVVGAGGMGKTQCALAFAHRHAADFPDGVWFFDLIPVRHAEQWVDTLALALSIPQASGDTIARIAAQFAGRHALLVLDNCDRLSTAIGGFVVEILRATQHVKVLATSQQHLNFVGERVLRMPALALPAIRSPKDDAELKQIATAPAVALLLARIAAVQPGFTLIGGNATAIVDICERLDGMPLALELAAARFAMLSAEQVLERLAHRFRFLMSESAGRDRRHRNLTALIEWSYQLLSSDEQRLLNWLSVFVQGWTVNSTIDIAAAFAPDAESVVDLLTGLADKSLVMVDQSLSPPRYRLLESVREFALNQLAHAGEDRQARVAHLQCMRRMAETAHRQMVSGHMRDQIALLQHEHGNIEAASEFATGLGNDPESALLIVGSLMMYFKGRGNHMLCWRLCKNALSAAPIADTRGRCLALLCNGVTGLMIKIMAPNESLLEARRIALQIGDAWTAAFASGYLAMWLADNEHAAAAQEHVVYVEDVAQRLQDEILRGLAGLARGWVHLANGALEECLVSLNSVRDLGEDLQQRHFIYVYLGLVLFRCNNFAAAAVRFNEGMRMGIALGHVRGAAGAVEGCAYLAERLDSPLEACRFLGAADQIRKRTGIPLYSFWIAHNNATLARLKRTLSPERFTAAVSAGAQLREEVAFNEVDMLLSKFALATGKD